MGKQKCFILTKLSPSFVPGSFFCGIQAESSLFPPRPCRLSPHFKRARGPGWDGQTDTGSALWEPMPQASCSGPVCSRGSVPIPVGLAGSYPCGCGHHLIVIGATLKVDPREACQGCREQVSMQAVPRAEDVMPSQAEGASAPGPGFCSCWHLSSLPRWAGMVGGRRSLDCDQPLSPLFGAAGSLPADGRQGVRTGAQASCMPPLPA